MTAGQAGPAVAGNQVAALEPPYRTALKPYGRALVELARRRPEIVCLSGDLTRQCEIDLFQAEIPDRFIHAGMAEANMMGVAGALARSGHIPFVHTFGVFATRRPLDQIVNAIAYPGLPVRIVGFMPGVSSPGGPSHQAIEDVALMRALPNMTVVDVADSREISLAVRAIADHPGPVYLRLKRGEIPAIFDDDHVFSLHTAATLASGDDVALISSGMMLPATLLVGLAFGLGFSSLTVAATAGVPNAEQGLAASLFQTSFQVGGAVVLAIVTAVIDAGGASGQFFSNSDSGQGPLRWHRRYTGSVSGLHRSGNRISGQRNSCQPSKSNLARALEILSAAK